MIPANLLQLWKQFSFNLLQFFTHRTYLPDTKYSVCNRELLKIKETDFLCRLPFQVAARLEHRLCKAIHIDCRNLCQLSCSQLIQRCACRRAE